MRKTDQDSNNDFSVELSFELGETSLALRRDLDRRAASIGITGAQWKLLMQLRATPELRQVDLANLLDVEPITLARIVDRLVASGLVERVLDPSDRRARRIRSTAKAERLAGQLVDVGRTCSADALGAISDKDVQAVRRTLARIRRNLSAS